MPPQEGCAIYKRPPDKRSTVFFLCRKRHGYTRDFLDWPTNRNLLGFQCRKRQCYTRDLNCDHCSVKDFLEFQCRKRQCYTRDSVSRGPHNCWAHTEIFTTFPFFPRNGGIFRGHRVFKISENIMSPIDFQGLIVSTIFCCNLPRFSGQKRKNYF